MATMGSVQGADSFFVTASAAKQAIAKLTSLRIHPHFSGYLAVVAAARLAKRTDNLKVNFQQFYNDYLLVSGAPPERPFLQPFSISGKGAAQLFNKNVAGSYAPSSLRSVAPIKAVVDFKGSGQGITQNLKADHEDQALKALTASQKVPVHSLATFLLRDHKIVRTGTSDADSLLQAFCETFGYDLTDRASASRFERLYQHDAETFSSTPFAEG